MKLHCPICGKQVRRENEQFPFCSERCRIVDLGNWSAEKYVISSAPIVPDAEEPDER